MTADELEPVNPWPPLPPLPPPPEFRPVLTPEEHTDRPLSPEEYARRANLLRRVRNANKLT
ncbi:hypothetical protein [Kitasatospora sp. GP82]|uniref:hypothetical protein n=1 Tax=Kitasatospora sp. GP82 TaxID=3035089 RepID=UPI002476A288|nr:hypothetical protein [Kitasatospora sp. GP82]MDH6123613.1 hypothetical protein [Kitasatospora sp. GP82]